MLKHSFSDFSYAVNIDSAKKGQKEVLVCFIYNGIEVLKKVYIPEKAGTAYVLEAKKIIDQEMRDGTLAIYSHKFINRNKRKKIQPKKVVAAAAKGEKIAPIATPADPSPKGSKKWVIATVILAVVAVAGATLAAVFATRGGGEEPGPIPTTKYLVSFDTDGGSFVPAQQVEEGKKAIKPNDPTKTEGEFTYDFNGWLLNGKPFDFNTSIDKDMVITASWGGTPPAPITYYTVEYNTNGGSFIESDSVESGKTLIKEAPVASKAGYEDTNVWYYDVQGSKKTFNFGEFGTPVESDMELYCEWSADQFDATFKPNGGKWTDGKQPEDKRVIPTEFGEIPAPGDIAKNGYTFLGWKREDGNRGIIPMPAEDITYTAEWELIPVPVHDVAFDIDALITTNSASPTVTENEPYTCQLYIKKQVASDYEIDIDNLAVYVGSTKLNIGENYSLTEKDEVIESETTRVLEIKVKEKTINNTLFITARSVQRSSVGDFNFEYNVGDKTAIVTSFNLKTGQKTEDITEIVIPDKTEYNGDDYEVIGIDATKAAGYKIGDGLLTNCSKLRKLTIPFVGLEKTMEIDTTKDHESHFFGALFGKNAFTNAEVPTYQDYWYKDGEHSLIDFAIPNTLREISITHYNNVKYDDDDFISSIPMAAFSNCAYITSVAINDSMPNEASIDRSAFSGCRSLNSFTYPLSENAAPTLTIGVEAFKDCGVLSSFDFVAIHEVQESAFKNCAGMASVYLPNSVEIIKEGAFAGYSGLVKCQPEQDLVGWEKGWVDQITPVIYGLPSKDIQPITCNPEDDGFVCSCLITETKDEVTNETHKWVYIAQYLGEWDDSDITIPEKLTFKEYQREEIQVRYIGSQSFMDYNKTPKIIINCPELISVGPEAFKKCYALTNIDFTNCTKLKTIGCNAFERCDNLTYVKGLDKTQVDTIGNYAFSDCPKLVGDSEQTKSLTLTNVTSVGASAFEYDESLTSITLHTATTDEKGVTFGSHAFNKCGNLVNINYNAVADDEGVYIIPEYCFYGTAIKEIIIPQCTTIIDTAAFAYCQSAETISFEGTDSGTGEEHDKNQVRTIGDSAFLRCTHLNYVGGQEKPVETYLPGKLESIGRAAFQDCFHLYGITCKGAAFKEIPDSMCYGDSKLDHFYYDTANAKFTKIGQFAFAQDQAFSYIGTNAGNKANYLPKTLREIGDRAFINCVSLGRYMGSEITDPAVDTPALHIQYDSSATDYDFKMGEQVFYGWYSAYYYQTQYKDYCNYNRLDIDIELIRKIQSGDVPGWKWTITSETHSGYTFYKYDQKSEGWNNPLYINTSI